MSDSTLSTVRDLLADPAQKYPPLKIVAELCDLTPRTLRRRLTAAGHLFQDLRETARLDRARHLLLHTDLTIEAISDQLGYSEPRGFHRAFRRWTGKCPGEYRREARR